MREPIDGVDGVYQIWEVDEPEMLVPLYSCRVQAGPPSPADDHLEMVSLGRLLGYRQGRCYLVQVWWGFDGGAGIFDGDYALADPGREAIDQDIVLAYVEGEPTVKRLRILDGRKVLVPEIRIICR
ncbi:MAG: peptidase S24 [Synechococcaceae cyanobacterium RM1_1_27]|nr:peptidase S24 [Synechococcaceae cyanobacterium RM1_1_27]